MTDFVVETQTTDVITVVMGEQGPSGAGGVDSTAIHKATAAEISVITEKGSPINADLVLIEDSADSNSKKRVQIGNLPAAAGSNDKVGIDSGATAGYLGAADSDGVLRVGSTLDYVDGGDFVTVDLDSTLETNYNAASAHVSADGSSHSDVVANTAKVTNATHTGEVTGSGALTVADNIIDEANLKVNSPTNDYILTADSGESGGMKWAAQAGGGDVSKVGTPVNNQVGVWTGDGTLEGDTDLTFDGSNLDVSGNITVGGTVDGIDIATDVAANTTHRGLTNNPHATDIDNIGSGTLAELNANISDANLDADSASRTPSSHASSHASGGADAIKLDDLSAPDDNTDLDASTSKHGLLLKLGGGTSNFLRADGSWATPAGGGDVSANGSPVDDDFAKFVNATDIEGRSYAEVKSDLNLEIGTDVLAQQTIGIANDNLVEIDDVAAADNEFAKFTVNGLEGRTYAETKTDLSLNAVENTALSTWAGTSNITTVGTLAAGNVDAAVTAADTTTQGKIEIATVAEAETGTDSTRAVTAAGVKAVVENLKKSVIVKCIADDTTLTTGNGKAQFTIPNELDGWDLISVGVHVYTTSSSGLPTFQIYNVTQTADMLSTEITIDATEIDSSTATTPAVIDAANDDVSEGDVLRFDCDIAGTGTEGMEMRLGFQLP